MRVARASIVAILALALAGSAEGAVSVRYDPSTDFSKFQSYEWQDGLPAARRHAAERIVGAVDQRLAAHGLRRVDADGELIVRYYVLVDAHTLEDLDDETDWMFWTGVRSVDPLSVGAGTLVVDMIDAGSGEIVWRGLASEALNPVPDKNLKKIDRAVRKMLDRLPATAP